MQSVRIYSPTLWKAAYRSRGPEVTAPHLPQANTCPVSVVVIPCLLSPPRGSHNKITTQSKISDLANIFVCLLHVFNLKIDTLMGNGLYHDHVLWNILVMFLIWVDPSPPSPHYPPRPPLRFGLSIATIKGSCNLTSTNLQIQSHICFVGNLDVKTSHPRIFTTSIRTPSSVQHVKRFRWSHYLGRG